MAFVVDVLKPWIDQHYRTLPDRRHTAIMGSSMGGLISTYAISRYSQVFGGAGIFSPAYWLAPQVFDLKRMVALLQRAGLPPRSLAVEVNPVGRHGEGAWRAEFPRAVAWLFGAGR